LTDIQLHLDTKVPAEQLHDFIELVNALVPQIEPGDSLKEIHVIADDALASTIQLLTDKPYQQGPHYPLGVAVPLEQDSSLSYVVLLRQALFAPDQTVTLERLSTILEELYHCKLYHQTWQRRGHIYPHIADTYLSDLFIACSMLHDEYAVARLKNTLWGTLPILTNGQGEKIPHYFEFGGTLTEYIEQGSLLLRSHDILKYDLTGRKIAALPIAYRSIFEPIARHAGFLTPIPPDYPLQAPNNIPEGNAFYREAVAPFWQTIKACLERSYANQFVETEQAIENISENINAFLDNLLSPAS
jgi:hypothetical protein